MTIIIHIDGLTEPVNPNGIACWGFIIEGSTRIERSGVIGEGRGMSNNLAEYSALCEALKECLKRGFEHEPIEVYSDNQMVVRQMRGEYGCHGGLYIPKYLEAKTLADKFKSIRFSWIPREENTEADALTRRAYEEYCASKGIKAEYGTQKHRQYKTSGDTCLSCKWISFSGPHATCMYGGTWNGWMPKSFYMRAKCEHYERLEK